eukprot:scaffold9324_cov144-Amphora_coffeaeformis.AAC.2
MKPISEKIKLGQQEIGWHVWQPTDDASTTTTTTTSKNNDNTKGPLVIVFHGFLAHGTYPTVRYAAELCATSLPGSTIVAADMPGHGLSDGPRGYLAGGTAESLIQTFGMPVLQHARTKYGHEGRKIFLLGSSMGGTIALQVALREPAGAIAGVCLLAPMLKLKVSALEEQALGVLAMIIPQWNVIPSSSTSAEKQYRDPEKRAECENDALTVKTSKICPASALTCVQLARTALTPKDDGDDNDSAFQKFPLWIGIADEDVVVDKTGSLDLQAKVQSVGGRVTAPVYPALHGLLCEPSPLYDQITNDLLTWIREQL